MPDSAYSHVSSLCRHRRRAPVLSVSPPKQSHRTPPQPFPTPVAGALQPRRIGESSQLLQTGASNSTSGVASPATLPAAAALTFHPDAGNQPFLPPSSTAPKGRPQIRSFASLRFYPNVGNLPFLLPQPRRKGGPDPAGRSLPVRHSSTPPEWRPQIAFLSALQVQIHNTMKVEAPDPVVQVESDCCVVIQELATSDHSKSTISAIAEGTRRLLHNLMGFRLYKVGRSWNSAAHELAKLGGIGGVMLLPGTGLQDSWTRSVWQAVAGAIGPCPLDGPAGLHVRTLAT